MTEEGIVFRLYPNAEQMHKLNNTFGACRFVFNRKLAERDEYYESHGEGLPKAYSTQCKELTQMRKELPWLAEISSVALQQSLKDLDTAFINFFKHGAEHPKFKSKRKHEDSFRIVQPAKTLIENGRIKIASIGKVRVKQSRPLEGRISSYVVSRTPSGKYYISITCLDVEKKPLPKTGRSVGIDLGTSHFATLSDGTVVDNPKYLIKNEDKLAHEQKKLSRKTKGSKNWEKQRIKVAKLHEKVANCRRDFTQKKTTEWIRKYDVICIEDLAVKEMMEENPSELAKRIGDVNFFEVRRELTYKADWYGKDIIVRDRYFPSTQRCYFCKFPNPETKNLSVRKWECPYCHRVHDRDLNASINLLLG